MIARHMSAINTMKQTRQHLPFGSDQDSRGLADLSETTVSVMDKMTRNWGFADSKLAIKRQRLANNLWKLTVENPKTRKIILEVEGQGDKVFAHEDNLARMAEALMEQGLKITTQFDN